MAWPYTPLTTYIPGGVPAVKALDLNSLQSVINSLYNGLNFFGTASDGNVTLGGTPSLGADGNYGTLVIPSGITLNTCGWAVYARTSITLAAGGTISGTPANSSGVNGGSYGGAGGGGPHSSFSGSDISGAAVFSSPFAASYGNQYALGGRGGQGGNGAAGTSATPANTDVTAALSYKTFPWRYGLGRNFSQVTNNYQLYGAGLTQSVRLPGSAVDTIRGGTSGSPGSGDNSNSGGAGGAGGALVILIAPSIIIQGALNSNGAKGGVPPTGNCGGGGGGGGGAYLFVCQSLSYAPTSVAVSGGASSLGVGTGAAGAAGAAGTSTPYQVILP